MPRQQDGTFAPGPRHTHFTRDIKPRGSGCPACEAYWNRAEPAMIYPGGDARFVRSDSNDIICHCTRMDGRAWEDPNNPCTYHFPKENS
ncbi:hypothetical protein SEA_BRUHMOMENT_4 [Arthrobacter phage BruhMoment]|nr:hypothetical protein SEA_BRUHMOMENT_4 [Arthrobacter phage BruhMoment]